MTTLDELARAAELHALLLSTETIGDFLQELAVVAARDVRDGLSCGITLNTKGLPRTVANSDLLAAQLDEVQYGFDDGPCLHAMRDEHLVYIDDTAGESRWPDFAMRAATHGVRSCLALPLVADGKTAGALNLYAPVPAAFGEAEVRRAELLAQNASGALAAAVRLASCVRLTEQLRAGLGGRLGGRASRGRAGGLSWTPIPGLDRHGTLSLAERHGAGRVSGPAMAAGDLLPRAAGYGYQLV